jgi:hypothetical protein
MVSDEDVLVASVMDIHLYVARVKKENRSKKPPRAAWIKSFHVNEGLSTGFQDPQQVFLTA